VASKFEKGGNPGVEKKPEWPPKKQSDVRQALGKTAVRGAQGKK
jgi:hypothetical protein